MQTMYLKFFNFAKQIMFLVAFVYLSFCLSVSNIAQKVMNGM